MKLGIKVGPQEQSLKDLEDANPPFAEVWFNIWQKDEYKTLFDAMKTRRMDVGLHFWGRLSNGIWANIGYSDTHITEQSMAMMKETIDIAAEHEFSYVNIHPSTRCIVKIDFDTESFEILSEPISVDESEKIFLENLKVLDDYAKRHHVVLTIETVPMRDTNGWRTPGARLHPLDLYQLPITTLVKAATEGFTIANDFGHTAANCVSSDRAAVWQFLRSATETFRANTRLLHLGYIIPPYNGTDFHNHFDNPQFESNEAIPNRNELKELLSLFKNREDVWALAEPDGRHVDNYFMMKKLLEEL